MRTTLLLALSALAFAAAQPAFADSPAVAAAFAAATPTRYEGSATFQQDDPESGNIRLRTYVFVMDASFRVNSLVVDGRRINGVSPETPLLALPYPKKGIVRNFHLSLQAWDDLSPAQPSPVYSGPVAGVLPGGGTSTTVQVSGFDLVAENENVSVSEVVVVPHGQQASGGPRAAGIGYAEHELLNRGDSVTVWLTPADLVRFIPLPEGAGPEGWSLVIGAGTTSGPVLVNGQWGFWAFLDPTYQWGYSFWLSGPGGFVDFGPLDPNGSMPDKTSIALAQNRVGGVEVVDLRQTYPLWKIVSSVIDGQFSAGEGYSTSPSHTGEAVSVRNSTWASGINVYYAGPAAYVVVRELDESGAQTKNGDGTPREWLVSAAMANYGTRESTISGFAPVQTGRSVILIVPTRNESAYGSYNLLVESVEPAKG